MDTVKGITVLMSAMGYAFPQGGSVMGCLVCEGNEQYSPEDPRFEEAISKPYLGEFLRAIDLLGLTPEEVDAEVTEIFKGHIRTHLAEGHFGTCITPEYFLKAVVCALVKKIHEIKR